MWGEIGDPITGEFIYPVLAGFAYTITRIKEFAYSMTRAKQARAKQAETHQFFLSRRTPEVPYDKTQKNAPPLIEYKLKHIKTDVIKDPHQEFLKVGKDTRRKSQERTRKGHESQGRTQPEK